MGQHRDGNLLDVVGQDVVTPGQGGVGEAPRRRALLERVAWVRSTMYWRTEGEVCTSRTARTIAETVAASVTGWSASRGEAPPWRSSMSSSARAEGYPIEIRAMKRSRCASGRG